MGLVAALARSGNWLDTDEPLSDAVLAEVAANGYQGVWRYVPLPGNPAMLDISAGELARICTTRRPDGTTLQCGLVQHCRSPAFNDLTKHDPELDARTAVMAAIAAGYAEGCHLELDFEGLLGTETVPFTMNTPAVCAEWSGFWQTVVLEARLRAMLYEGYDVPLTGDQLYMLPGFDQYERGLGGKEVATRGCSMHQGAAVVIRGVKFDRIVVAPDRLGDLPWVCSAA